MPNESSHVVLGQCSNPECGARLQVDLLAPSFPCQVCINKETGAGWSINPCEIKRD